jgi:predicted ABC-class ATPase
MARDGWEEVFRSFLSSWAGDAAVIDTPNILFGTTAFLVRSFDGNALQFGFPIRIPRDLPSEIDLDLAGLDGATSALIERIKEHADKIPELGPLFGKGAQGSLRYHDTIEPYTIIHSEDAIGSQLWKADNRNYCDDKGVHFVVHGALPYPSGSSDVGNRRIFLQLADLAEAVGVVVQKAPLPPLRTAWLASLDQKLLRKDLRQRGLVSFVGDGSHLARTFSRNRPFFRVAGPKEGVSIPFCCPTELDPTELELLASNRTVTGLGIRKREVFAIAGSNAQGKTTFL